MAAAAARAGARVLLEGGLARRPGETKSPGNFVTEADRNSEAEIVEVLAREAPGIPILAEEAEGTPAGIMWAALDGTTNFMRSLPVVAALDLSWTAAGNLDGFFELGLAPCDVAAGATLVLETGGVVSDWSGGAGWLQSGDILAAAPAIHEKLVELAGQPREG